MKRLRKRVWLLIVAVVVCTLLGIGLSVYRLFFVKLVRVPTGSMQNTIFIGDQVLVTRRWGVLQRGQVVMFRYPGDSDNFICRIIGLPNETVQVKGTSVLINNKMLDEERVYTKPQDLDSKEPLEEISVEGNGPYRVFYISRDSRSEDELDPGGVTTFGTYEPFRLGNDEYFLMGDHRDNSADSRYRGAVPRELIWGTASMIYFSAPINSDEVRWERMFKRIR